MGKVDENKQNKRSSLLSNAYDLFTERGFSKTTISDISKKSGLAKGTFYLYFKDKYDIRDVLIARKSAQLLEEADHAVRQKSGVEEYILGIVDYLLNYLSEDKRMMRFIYKNLSWGIFKHAVESTGKEEADNFEKFKQSFSVAMQKDHYQCSEPELLLFTIIEPVSSTGCSVILYESPCDLKTYLPFLHNSIHLLLEGYRIPEGQQAAESAAQEKKPRKRAQNTALS